MLSNLSVLALIKSKIYAFIQKARQKNGFTNRQRERLTKRQTDADQEYICMLCWPITNIFG